MFSKYDRVKIVDVPEDNPELYQLIGKEAMIIDVDKRYDYPYELCFFDREAQELSMWHGNLLFNDYHLEPAEEKNVEGAKREIRRLRESLKYNKTVDGWKIREYLRRIERML